MATILDKDLTRESTVKVADREIQITITADQKITMKLKGMKTGAVEISIEDLYKQLKGDVIDEEPKAKSVVIDRTKKKQTDDEPMINLHDLRSRLNVAAFDYNTTVKFDGIVKDLIDDAKNR
jgi:hypothetical protein